MEIIFHWTITKQKFANWSKTAVSAKNKTGAKPLVLNQSTYITIDRERLDIKFKRKLEAELTNRVDYLRTDLKCAAFIGGKLYTGLPVRSFKELSNKIVNLLLMQRNFNTKDSFDKTYLP